MMKLSAVCLKGMAILTIKAPPYKAESVSLQSLKTPRWKAQWPAVQVL